MFLNGFPTVFLLRLKVKVDVARSAAINKREIDIGGLSSIIEITRDVDRVSWTHCRQRRKQREIEEDERGDSL